LTLPDQPDTAQTQAADVPQRTGGNRFDLFTRATDAMNNMRPRDMTNSILDVLLFSLKSWPRAKEISPCPVGGPYVVLQEGYDPEDFSGGLAGATTQPL